MARRDNPIPTGRIRRTARVGTLVGTQAARGAAPFIVPSRSEEHTSELQSRLHLVCRLLLEKKKTNNTTLSPNTYKTLFELLDPLPKMFTNIHIRLTILPLIEDASAYQTTVIFSHVHLRWTL